MEIKLIVELLDKYYGGKTTLEEERELKHFFSTRQCPFRIAGRQKTLSALYRTGSAADLPTSGIRETAVCQHRPVGKRKSTHTPSAATSIHKTLEHRHCSMLTDRNRHRLLPAQNRTGTDRYLRRSGFGLSGNTTYPATHCHCLPKRRRTGGQGRRNGTQGTTSVRKYYLPVQ